MNTSKVDIPMELVVQLLHRRIQWGSILVQDLRNQMELVDIPVADIKVLNRLRKTDAHKIQELAESIKDIGLLHPIAVAEKDNEYVLLSGEHRLSSYKLLDKPTIPCVVRENNPLINQLV